MCLFISFFIYLFSFSSLFPLSTWVAEESNRKCMRTAEIRLRVVSNSGDGDCAAGEIYTRARNFEKTRRKGSASRLLEISRTRVYFARSTIAIAKISDYSQSMQRGFTCTLHTVRTAQGWSVAKNMRTGAKRTGAKVDHRVETGRGYD